LREANSLLNDAMEITGYDENERRRIHHEVQMRFPGVLKSLLTHPATRQRFVAFGHAVQLGSEEERVYSAWNDHIEYQRSLFEDKPVFGEEPFSLANVYVETECGVITCEELLDCSRGTNLTESCGQLPRGRPHSVQDPFDENVGGRQSLVESVMNLIGDPTFRDAIVVQGPAGSGKSAFTLRLCLELQRHNLKPIRIRFRDIALSLTNIEDTLPRAVQFWDLEERPEDVPSARPDELFLNMTLFDQTVAFGEAIMCPWVLILDGWDEVSVAAHKGFEVRVREILTQIRDRFLSRGNRPIVRVILTGRPSDAVSSSSFISGQTRLLTIRALRPDQLRSFVNKLAERLADSKNPEQAVPERFGKVLDKYQEDFNAQATEKTGGIQRSGPMEVLGLPLLTHLAVRLMIRWPTPDLHRIVENPTSLYRLLTNLTCEKGGRYGEDVHESEIRGGDLRRLLQETAAAMTVFGQDSIPYEELDLRLSQLDEELVDRVQAETKGHPLSSLMISFFFKGGRVELGAEFLHKSFREYLFAEAILETLKDYGRRIEDYLPERNPDFYWKDFDETDGRYDLSRRLGKMLAPQWISNEIAEHLKGLIEWELSRAHGKSDQLEIGADTPPLDMNRWKRVRDGLADLWDWWGEAVHLRMQPDLHGKKLNGWKQAYVDELVKWSMPQDLGKGVIPAASRPISVDAHLGDGLFRLAVLIHHFIAVPSGQVPEWAEFEYTPEFDPGHRRYQSWGAISNERHVRFRPSGPSSDYFFNYMARINAAGWHPGRVFPSELSLQSVDLGECFLALAGMAQCDLSGTNLRGANSINAYFRRANLSYADLTSATARDACFSKCIFFRTRCRQLYAEEASFVGTDLQDALDAGSICRDFRETIPERKSESTGE
jgi:hypothetical protein